MSPLVQPTRQSTSSPPLRAARAGSVRHVRPASAPVGCSAVRESRHADRSRWLGDTAVEQHLVARARQGDAAAFELLVRRGWGFVCGYLTRVFGSSIDVEQVAQEAFSRAWCGLARFRGDALFTTWVCRIAVNQARSQLLVDGQRRRARLDESSLAAADGDPAASAESAELLRHLRRWLEDLPEHYRSAVVLRDLRGLSNEEGASVLGLSVANFKSRVHRGRAALRERREQLDGNLAAILVDEPGEPPAGSREDLPSIDAARAGPQLVRKGFLHAKGTG